jgi:hypothetical protein
LERAETHRPGQEMEDAVAGIRPDHAEFLAGIGLAVGIGIQDAGREVVVR